MTVLHIYLHDKYIPPASIIHGTADGKYDCQLINSVLPGLRWYEAVDIDPESLQQLQQKHRSTKSNYQVKELFKIGHIISS